ncbi:hypothetical protein DM02DRAFT_670702 [Periconia macrospinosa]|uniref:Uncharacterized protein n=1 Tax=Periconia macrospinosa TaxID=97972 RepID=A0A2V1DW46_9PLEO|nr:hypothetical protein DM02DRAFT_670702 [Periconia macrospinosa]
MMSFPNPSIIEPPSDIPRKKRRLDTSATHSTSAAHTFDGPVNCRIGNTVCYGMIDGLPVQNHPNSTALEPSPGVPLHLYDRTLRRRSDNSIVGTLERDTVDTFAELADRGVEFQLSATLTDETLTRRQRKTCLEVIFYGPKTMADAVGLLMEKCGYSLQDPCDCDRNVPYHNPHRLSSQFGDPPMTYDIQQSRRKKVDTLNDAAMDVFHSFQTSEHLALAPTPTALNTNLNLHQQQALTFFQRREMGHDFGIWQARSSGNHAPLFCNVITDKEQSSKPPLWRGGILADEMGLGKTLSMIALIATDKDVSINCVNMGLDRRSNVETQSTLVIVPPNVLANWEMQLKRHVIPGRLTWMRHQGRSRMSAAPGARISDIVLTTYQTVESEYRRDKGVKNTLLSLHWKRIVLDEAHIIRNCKTSTAKAISSLHATSRWAVSGTPIQNGLPDLFGLFKFLHFKPYNDAKVFDEDIAELTRNKTLEESIERLKRLLSCVMIRRNKASVAVPLPPRSEKTVRLQFTPQEKSYYESIERPAAEALENQWGNTQAYGSMSLSILQQIHSLRLVCNLGTLAAPPHSGLALDTLGDDATSRALIERMIMGDASCQNCLAILDHSVQSLQPDHAGSRLAYYSTCYRLFCANCTTLCNFTTPHPCDCESANLHCRLNPISLQNLTPASTPQCRSVSPSANIDSGVYTSTKVLSLLSELKAYPDEKSVIFSFWTSSLDMVETALRQENIDYVRIDGKISPNARMRALEKYKEDPKIKAMLITTSCGAVGIDLTAATRVHLLEPQWNPTVEEQAIARIHRIGQTRPVTTIRYIVEGSIEEHIKDVVQDRKRLLVSLLLPSST